MKTKTQYYLTALRVKELQEELKFLRDVKEPEIANEISISRTMEGMEDNTNYDILTEEQNLVTSRIRDLETILATAKLIKNKAKSKAVNVGCKVTVEVEGRLDTFIIVGSNDASPFEGRISLESPVGKSLMGCKVGEEVLVETEMYSTFYKVVDIANG